MSRPPPVSRLASAVVVAAWVLAPAMPGHAGEPPQPNAADLATARGADRLALLNRLAAGQVDKDPAQAMRWADEALTLARTLGDRGREAEAVYLLADSARAAGEHRLALERFHLAREMFARLGNPLELGRSLRRIGDLYYFLADYEQALRHYLAALEKFEDLTRDDPKGKGPLHVAHLHAAIGNVLRASQDTAGARQSYERALADYQRLEYLGGIAGTYYNLGLTEEDLGHHREALDHYDQSRAAAVSLGDDYLRSLALSSAGSTHLKLGNLDRAEALVREAMQICEQTQRQRGILSNLLRLAEVQQARGAHREAAATLGNGIDLAIKLGDRRLEADAVHALASSQEAMGDAHAALPSFRRFVALDAELVGAEKTSRLKRLQIAHETAKREQEIALLTAQRERDRLLRSMVLGALASSLLVLGLVYSRYRLRVRTAREIAAKNAQLELAYARVEELSRTDELTASPNRRAILERLALERARCERTGSPLALALADVDDFKRCNDMWGHECGDEVLRAVAHTLRGAVRATDAVGRLGGEEFLLVLPDTDLEGARLAAEKARACVEAAPIRWREQQLRVTVTVGVCAAEHETGESALRRADQAMYRGKRNGKNRVEVAADQSTRTA
ncbi:MAG: diguanylate cyclase [Thermoanaerobaculaceae bacterium]